ncbi:hypothetical protein Tco_0076071 [Tanacetum coccineum]
MEYDFNVSTVEGFTTASIPVTTAGIEISTANMSVSTASVTPEVSIAAENLVYIRRSAEKRKDKGKAIMKEDKYVQKKSKKQLEQERLRHEEAIRLQGQINEEERQRIARDAEITKQLQEDTCFDRKYDARCPGSTHWYKKDMIQQVQKDMTFAVHMMIEKKYPLTLEMLSRMLSRRLEVDQESEMEFELLRFIRSQLH